MKRLLVPYLLLLPLTLCCFAETIVPKEETIDDDSARLELAKLLSYSDATQEEALEQYHILFEAHPHDADLVLAISRIHIAKKRFQTALTFLYPAIKEHPLNSTLYLEASRSERELGHLKQSQILILEGIALAEKKELFLLDYAETLMLAGSFYKAKEIYEEALSRHPGSLDLSLKLGWNLVSSQRYEEAEGLYQLLLLNHPDSSKVLEALATLKMLEKNFCQAISYLDLLIGRYPSKPAYVLMKGAALYSHANYSEAIQAYQEAIALGGPEQTRAWIGLGKAYLKRSENEKAQKAFEEAYASDPDSIEAQYYLAGPIATTASFIEQLLAQPAQPEQLERWAAVYAENGTSGLVQLHQAALEIDPDYYPAQVALADALGALYQYEEAIGHLLPLLDTFPDASKIMMAIARVLSWGKQYECSFQWYDRLIDQQPDDPVPRREKARVAYWGYYFDDSMSIYGSLLSPSVDKLLLAALVQIQQECFSPFVAEGIKPVSKSLSNCSIYHGYEVFEALFHKMEQELETTERNQIDRLLIQYLPLYRIQKGIFLESDAKRQDWQNYFFHALPIYEKLAAFSPGNEEALYGFAQDYCSLGLCGRSRQLYAHILNIDPNHSLVQMALQRNLLKENWLVQSNYTYWKERGIGQFSQSQIARHQFDEIAEWSPSCDCHFRFMQNVWVEFPYLNHNKYYPAEGQTIEMDKQLTDSIKGSAGATYKTYFNQFPSRTTGFATLWFNCNDYFNLGVGYQQRNEIYNLYSLKQGIQAKNYWATLSSNLTHYWTMSATYHHLDYNDSNTMEHVEVSTSYTFSDDPNVFKIIFQGSYRNTAHLSEFVIDPVTGKVTNVIHPYWTPQDYYSNSITLEYRRNFAFFNYCEAPLHYLDIQITAEDDTARNPSLQLAFEWRRDFMRHWGFSIKGMIHQSKLWNAEGAWMNVYYRF